MTDMPNEISARKLRENLAAALNDVAVRGQTIWVTNHGRRIAAIVPVPVAEQMDQPPG
jgi:prevent-host-death family protein